MVYVCRFMKTPEEMHEETMAALRKVYGRIDEVVRLIGELPRGEAQQGLTFKAKQPNPAFTLLKGRMFEMWMNVKGTKYAMEPRDAKGISDLLRRKLTIDVVVAQWKRAIMAGEGSMFGFALNFNKYNESAGASRPSASAADLYAEKPNGH